MKPTEPPRVDPALEEMDQAAAGSRVERIGWVMSLVVILLSLAAVIVAFLLRPVHAAAPTDHPCREGLLEWLDKGDITVCYGHLVPPETWAAAQAAVDELPTARERIRVLEEQVTNLRVQAAEARANGEARLLICENVRGLCEAAKTPPKCREPSLLDRGEFSWPTGIAAGFIGGIAFDRWGLKCR